MKPDPLNLLYPAFRVACAQMVIAFDERHAFKLLPHNGLRTFADQAADYALGRTITGKKVTNAKPGHSRHQYGVGLDCIFEFQGDPYGEHEIEPFAQLWKDYGDAAKAQSLTWGGDFKPPAPVDLDHVQAGYGLTATEMLTLFNEGGIVRVWSEFDDRRDVKPASEWSAMVPGLLAIGLGLPKIPWE